MKHLRQFLFASLLAFLALATLSACSSQQAGSSTKRVTITFWHGMTDSRKTELNHLIRTFNNSQTTYKVIGSSQGNIVNVQQKITAAAKSKTLPTIAQTVYTNVPDYVRGDIITPFDPYIKKNDLSDLHTAFRQSINYQGKAYSMPFSRSARILFYNKTLLKKEGLKVPTTWADIQKDGLQLKSKGITAMAFDQNFVTEADGLTRQAGSPLFGNGFDVNLTNKKSLAAIHVIWDMLQNGTATTAGTDGYGSVAFFKGKTLFYSGSSAGISTMQAITPKGMRWGTATLPSYQGQKASSNSGNDIVMFKSASKAQRKGAAAFVKFLMSQKQTIKWAEKTGYVPLTKSAKSNAGYQRFLAKNPTAKAAENSLSFGFQDKPFLGYNQYLVAVGKSFDEMTANHVTPEKAMTQLQKQLPKMAKEQQK